MKLDRSLDTAEEASSVATLVGNSPFILVTSAYHMPRAVRLMQLAGARPNTRAHRSAGTPAPGIWRLGMAANLISTPECPERALHEYMGLAIVK